MGNKKATWRPIKGFDGYYMVSQCGKIKSVRRTILRHHKNGKITSVRLPGKRVAAVEANGGYWAVSLHKNNSYKRVRVHIAVAGAFIGDCPPGSEVNHIDFNRKNNSVENLEYATRLANVRHSISHGRFGGRKRRPVIRSDGAYFESMGSAARSIGARLGNLYQVLNGKRKSVKGFSFEFA